MRSDARCTARAPFHLAAVRAAIFAAAALVGHAARAAYSIQQGDTIEIAVAGLPELSHRGAVQPDGAISFPLFDALTVEGLSPAELRAAVQQRLAGKIYRQHTNDGREVLTVIQQEEVSAEIVAYRPIYVTGSVAKAGEQTFRPGMTVRQALALAGGADPTQGGFARSHRDRAAVQADWELALVDLAAAAVRRARVVAELDGQTELGGLDLGGVALPRERLLEIEKSETDILRARMDDFQREHDFLEAAVKQAAERIEVVEKQRQQEEAGSQADTVELQRMIELLSRGQEISPRVTEARRALLLSSTRALQVNVELLELKRQQSESIRNVQRFEDDRRAALLKELQDTTTAAIVARVKRHAFEVELKDAARAQSVDPLAESFRPAVVVVRRTRDDSSRSTVDDDFVLMPGDVVEVRTEAAEPSGDPVR